MNDAVRLVVGGDDPVRDAVDLGCLVPEVDRSGDCRVILGDREVEPVAPEPHPHLAVVYEVGLHRIDQSSQTRVVEVGGEFAADDARAHEGVGVVGHDLHVGDPLLAREPVGCEARLVGRTTRERCHQRDDQRRSKCEPDSHAHSLGTRHRPAAGGMRDRVLPRLLPSKPTGL